MNNMKKLIVLILATIFVAQYSLTAQTGPAGVGNKDGSNGHPKNLIWLDAGTITGLNDDAEVSTWTDKSGNNIEFVQSSAATSGGEKFVSLPHYVAVGGANTFPLVRFSHTYGTREGSGLVKNNFLNFPTEHITTFVVYRTESNESNDGILSYSIGGGGSSNTYLIHNSLAIKTSYNGREAKTGLNYSDGNFHILSNRWINTQGIKLSKDGDVDYTNTSSTFKNISLSEGGTLAIGGEQDALDGMYDNNQALDGDIAEIIMYDAYLNDAQKMIIENYLSLKYGISITNDFFALGDAAYNDDLCGIGQQENGNQKSTKCGNTGFYIEAINNLNNGEFVMLAHNNAVTNEVSTDDIAGAVEQRWKKDWYLELTGSFGTQITFDLPEGISGGQKPQDISNYVLLYRNAVSGNYSVVPAAVNFGDADQVQFKITASNMKSGYYTLGTINSTDSPVTGINTNGSTWYALASGNWNDSKIWTLDPAGILYKNPNSYFPHLSTDKVVIGTGKNVEMNLPNSNYTFESVTVDGRLDLKDKSGLKFIEIKGTGRILMSADVFPEYSNADHFIKAGQGEGTLVLYGNTDFNLNTSPYEFFNVEVKMDANHTVTLLKDFQINGNLRIENGILQINDNSTTTNLNLKVDGDIDILSGAAIITGTANARHQLDIKGNLTNKGTLKFTNRTAPDYVNEATDGIVDANFINSTANQNIKCNGISNFYRIEINKGTDQTYILSIDADDAEHFKLMGAAKYHHSPIAQLTDNNNALGLIKGTVRIGANVNIPTLNSLGNYNISINAQLWVDGGTVIKPKPSSGGAALVPYGTIRITSGKLESLGESGITIRGNGLLIVEGGILNSTQIRTSVLGSANVGGYIQSGGTVNLSGDAYDYYYRFCLTYAGNVFNMSGGTLNIKGATYSSSEPDISGGIFINSDPENINVTGGTVVAEITDNNSDFRITSKAPFYNLILRQNASITKRHILSDGKIKLNASNSEELSAQPLVVLNDLIIEKNTFLNHGGKDITVGHNLTIENGAQTQGGSGDGSNNIGLYYNSSMPNTLTFNGSNDSEFSQGSTNTSNYPFKLSNLIINKTEGKQVLMSAATNLPVANNNMIDVLGTTNIQKGILNNGTQSICLSGSDVKIGENAVLGVYKSSALSAFVTTATNNNTLITSETGAQIGNLQVNKASGSELKLKGDVYINRIGYYSGLINLDRYNMKLDNLHTGNTSTSYTGGSLTSMFYTQGKASNGGISLKITKNGTYTFPIGVSGKYTPAVATISNFSGDAGYLQIRPVNDELSTVTPTGVIGSLLSYYWRVGHIGFSALPNVSYTFYYDESDEHGLPEWYVAGKVLDEDPYTRWGGNYTDVDDNNNIISFSSISLERANYTAGYSGRFTGDVEVYYSIKTNPGGDWTDRNTWSKKGNLDSNLDPHDSNQTVADDYPKKGDIAEIGFDPTTKDPHVVIINSSVECANLIFKEENNTEGIPIPRRFVNPFVFRPTVMVKGNVTLNSIVVSGVGTFWMWHNDPDYSKFDMGEFASQDSSYVLYEYSAAAGASTILQNNPTEFPNLILSSQAWGDWDSNVSFSNEIKTNGNFEIIGDANYHVNSNLTIDGNLMFTEIHGSQNSGGGASFVFESDNPYTVSVGGDLQMINSSASIVGSSTGTQTHVLEIKGDITQKVGNAARGFNLSGTDCKINLILSGDSSMIYNRLDDAPTAIPQFNRIIVNKGTNNNVTATINADFDLNGATKGVGVEKALELQNGTLILNHNDIDINLSTGNDLFNIPASAGIELRQGKATVTGETGILLDGKILVSGGTLDMTGTNINNGNNYIEYSASGNANIEITGGTLSVGSQVRRGLKSIEGILHYKQTGGVFNVGVNSAKQNNRGIFEISNASTFTHEGGEFNIVNDYRSNPSIASFYFNPETANLSQGTNINFATAKTVSSEKYFKIYAAKPLQNLTINSDKNPIVYLDAVPLSINENLTINSGAILDAKGLNLNIKGNFVNAGTYVPNKNETVFEGSKEQTITGNTTFYKFTKNTDNNLTLASNSEITVDDLLNLTAGTFNDGGNNVIAKGNVHSVITTSSTASGDGIVLQGSENQTITGSGTYAKLTTDNGNGILVPTGNTLTITEQLKMQAGVLDIGKNLIKIGENAQILEANVFSNNNMIQTNMSFTDAGIQKSFVPISSNTQFICPIGSMGKYTPVTFNISNSSTHGYIRIIAADEMHPSIINDTENPEPQIVDKDHVLQYYWRLDAENMSNFSADVNMQSYLTDIKGDGSEYITARLLNKDAGVWSKYSKDDFDENTGTLQFKFTSTNDLGIDGTYTAGEDPAIPEQVAAYITKAQGNWNNKSIWDTYPSSGGQVPEGGPRGAIVYIKHEVIANNNVNAYETHILNNGIVNVGNTFGHRLGVVDGKGTLYLETGEIPAGRYDGFFAADSGTIHFAGSTNYDILSEISSVNNIIFTGSGERRFPNLDLTVDGDLTIGSGSDNPQVINEHNDGLIIRKNITFKSGTFDAGYGDHAIVTIGGKETQKIIGNFTKQSSSQTNAFNHFRMNNEGGLDIAGQIEIDNKLILTKGVIRSDASNTIKLTNKSSNIVTGGSNVSHVDGPLLKNIVNGQSFDFPVGNNGRYGTAYIASDNSNSTGYWEVQYYNESTKTAGYDPDSKETPLTVISNTEYWRMKSPNPSTVEYAKAGVSWNNNSQMPTDDAARSSMRIAEWNGTKWVQVDPDNTISGTAEAGTVKSTVNSEFDKFSNKGNIFTLSTDYVIANPTWTGNKSTVWADKENWNPKIVPISKSKVTISAHPDGNKFPEIGSNASCNTMDLQSGAKLTIKPKGSLILTGNLTMNGNITILSDASGTGSLIDNGTISKGSGTFGTATVQRYLYGIGDGTLMFHYISSPLSKVSNSKFIKAPWGANNYNFYLYNEATDNEDWLQAWDNTTPRNESSLRVGAGYAFAFSKDYTANMTGGIFNTGKIKYAASYTDNNNETVDGWNLIGNPYPSAIDADKFIESNKSIIRGTIYFWDDDITQGKNYESNDYAVWNKAGSISSNSGAKVPDGFISNGQGFFVKAKNTAGTTAKVTFTNSMRAIGNGQFFKATKKQNDNATRIRVAISNEKEKLYNEALIVFMDEASDGFDDLYDGVKNFGNTDIGFYSLLNEKPFAIQALSKVDTRYIMYKEVPMGYKTTKTGTFVFNAIQLENIDSKFAVYLKDKQTKKVVELNQGKGYEFKSQSGQFDDRFSILFSLREESVNHAPELRYNIDDVTVMQDSLLTYSINKNTFDDVDAYDKLTHKVSLEDGSKLPSWLQFNEQTFTFSGTPKSENIGKLSIKITATDQIGESASSVFVIEVLKSEATAVDDITKENKVLIYPNPTRGTVFIKTTEHNVDTYFTVRDNNGRIMKEQNANGTLTELNLNNFSDGLYFIEMKTNKIRKIYKIILRK